VKIFIKDEAVPIWMGGRKTVRAIRVGRDSLPLPAGRFVRFLVDYSSAMSRTIFSSFPACKFEPFSGEGNCAVRVAECAVSVFRWLRRGFKGGCSAPLLQVGIFVADL